MALYVNVCIFSILTLNCYNLYAPFITKLMADLQVSNKALMFLAQH